MKTAYDIVIRPVISEKATDLMADRKYIFEVHKKANKIEIKKAVELVFGVTVSSVSTMIVKSKPKRQGKFSGRTRTWKKAIVKVTPSSKEIEFFEGM